MKDIGVSCGSGFVRKDQWGLVFLRCEEPSRMPGLQLASRLFLSYRLVDGVATAHWFGGSCHMSAAWMFCVSAERPM